MSNGRDFEMGRWDVGMYAVPDIPIIRRGDDLARLIAERLATQRFELRDQDVVVVAHKVVSKAEGAVAKLDEVEPSPRATELARATGRDARLCEVYVRESAAILGTKGSMVITRHRLGFECTNAGVDRSNTGAAAGEAVVLLPRDPDASARGIRAGLRSLAGTAVAVVISDSFGKPDREGALGAAIGIAGIRHLEEYEARDLSGRPSNPSINLVDELASAASMLMGESGEGRPVVVVRGVRYTPDESASLPSLLGPPA